MPLFITFNGASPTSAAQQKVTTGTVITTLLQIATPSTRQLEVVEWGISFDGTGTAGVPGQCELIQTTGAATVTAHVAAGVVNLDPNGPASLMTLGTAATGFTASAEGTPGVSRTLDAQLVSPAVGYTKTFMPSARPLVAISKFLRIRVTFAVAVNATCWVTFKE